MKVGIELPPAQLDTLFAQVAAMLTPVIHEETIRHIQMNESVPTEEELNDIRMAALCEWAGTYQLMKDRLTMHATDPGTPAP